MNIFQQGLPVVHLKPAEMVIAKKPTIVSTVLGSCVSVVMHCPRTGIGIICHGVLPGGRTEYYAPDPDNFKYMDYSINYMYRAVLKLGILSNDLEVKMFGGASLSRPQEKIVQNINFSSVGKMNIDMTTSTLKSLGLKLKAYDVGGKRGRKIFFYTHTGKVIMKRLRNCMGEACKTSNQT